MQIVSCESIFQLSIFSWKYNVNITIFGAIFFSYNRITEFGGFISSSWGNILPGKEKKIYSMYFFVIFTRNTFEILSKIFQLCHIPFRQDVT